jgi:hypothetical protein
MPNWCHNNLKITFPKKCEKVYQYISDLMKEINSEEGYSLNNFVIPLPNGEWDYDWCILNWDTKWEIELTSVELDDYHEDVEFIIGYDTAWSPNINVSMVLYKKLKELAGDEEFELSHSYEEECPQYYGIYNGIEDRCYEPSAYYYYMEDSCNDLFSHLKLKALSEKTISFEEIEDLFLIKSISKEEQNYYDLTKEVEKIECYSAKYGEVYLYKIDNNYLTSDINLH